MIESEWYKAKDPDAMLTLVAPHLSPRQWQFLACEFIRRTWDLLADDRLRAAVDEAERHAGNRVDSADTAPDFGATTLASVDAVGEAQRLVVLAADPDSDPERYRHTDARRTNPSAPLFQAAARNAAQAVVSARSAAARAAEAVTLLVSDFPSLSGRLERIRERVIEATREQAAASLSASLALKLKSLGDEWADRDTGRNVRLRYSSAMETVRREEEYAGYREADLLVQKQRADRKALGRFLLDVCGNPLRRVAFSRSWRTATVIGLATTIDDHRAYDRLPILADALLDAGCDSETVLRHCRGTEPHDPDCHHARGCWVIELMLERGTPVYVGASPTRHRAVPAARRGVR